MQQLEKSPFSHDDPTEIIIIIIINKETIPFTIASEGRKYLGINLPMIVKDIYLEKHNTLMKEIETEKSDQDRRVVGCESHTSKIHLCVE